MSLLVRLLRLRYLLFGTAVGGGYAAHKKYEDIKKQLPDLTWMKEYLPENAVDNLSKRLSDLKDSVSLPDTSNLQDRIRQLQDSFYKYLTPSQRLVLGSTDEQHEGEKNSDGLFAWAASYKNVQNSPNAEEHEKLARVR
ncbi:unnamed protein product, partial [Didymodactylos carnosus]